MVDRIRKARGGARRLRPLYRSAAMEGQKVDAAAAQALHKYRVGAGAPRGRDDGVLGQGWPGR